MKNLLILSMIFSLFGCHSGTHFSDNNRKLEGAFRYYEFNHTNMRTYPVRYYRVDCEDDGMVTLAWAQNGSDTSTIEVSQEVPEQIDALIKEYRLYKLKKFYKPPFHVLDGEMWHVYIGYESGSVSSNGDNAWPPESLRAGINAINAYLDTLIPAVPEE